MQAPTTDSAKTETVGKLDFFLRSDIRKNSPDEFLPAATNTLAKTREEWIQLIPVLDLKLAEEVLQALTVETVVTLMEEVKMLVEAFKPEAQEEEQAATAAVAAEKDAPDAPVEKDNAEGKQVPEEKDNAPVAEEEEASPTGAPTQHADIVTLPPKAADTEEKENSGAAATALEEEAARTADVPVAEEEVNEQDLEWLSADDMLAALDPYAGKWARVFLRKNNQECHWQSCLREAKMVLGSDLFVRSYARILPYDAKASTLPTPADMDWTKTDQAAFQAMSKLWTDVEIVLKRHQKLEQELFGEEEEEAAAEEEEEVPLTVQQREEASMADYLARDALYRLQRAQLQALASAPRDPEPYQCALCGAPCTAYPPFVHGANHVCRNCIPEYKINHT
jgi:hypothetical protein